MAINGMSVGRDYELTYYDADTREIVSLGDVQNVSIQAMKHEIKNEPYNDDPSFGFIPGGYSFSFTAVRTGSALEDFQLAANTRFSQGQNSVGGYLNETIHNPDDTTSTYQYTKVVLWIDDIGDISRDKPVMIKGIGRASKKKRVQ